MKLPIAAHKVIPHRDSMLLIDTLVASAQGAGTVEATLTPSSVAATPDGTLSQLIYVELMAQAYAAVKGWEITQSGMDFPIGYLVGVQKFQVHKKSRVGKLLIINVTTIGEFEGFAIVEGTIFRAGSTVATGKIKLWVPPEEV